MRGDDIWILSLSFKAFAIPRGLSLLNVILYFRIHYIKIFNRTEMKASPKANKCSWLIPVHVISVTWSPKVNPSLSHINRGLVFGIKERTDSPALL